MVAEKMAKNFRGLFYFAAPFISRFTAYQEARSSWCVWDV